MCSNVIFGLFFSLILNCNSVSTDHWMNLRRSMQSSFPDDVTETNNGTDLSQDLIENNIKNTSETEVLFWTIPETNDTMDVPSEVQMEAQNESEISNDVFQPLEDSTNLETNDTSFATTNPTEPVPIDNNVEENSPTDILYNDMVYPVMDEKIVLQRNNCHLEISVLESHDIRIEIKFGKLQNNTSGKCYITLNGQENNMLGVLISNIYLYQNASEGEILKVITTDFGSDYVLKEYYSWTKYQPLLLTETHKVYIVLYYHVTNVPPNQQDSHFNLEVFNYHKYENYVNHGITHHESDFPYNNGVQNLSTSFVPYFY